MLNKTKFLLSIIFILGITQVSFSDTKCVSNVGIKFYKQQKICEELNDKIKQKNCLENAKKVRLEGYKSCSGKKNSNNICKKKEKLKYERKKLACSKKKSYLRRSCLIGAKFYYKRRVKECNPAFSKKKKLTKANKKCLQRASVTYIRSLTKCNRLRGRSKNSCYRLANNNYQTKIRFCGKKK